MSTSKRILDIVIAVLALVLLSPVIVAIALMIWLLMGPPVLFHQPRPGLHGEVFRLIKFRTMTDERDENGYLLPNSKRLTRLGRFLRNSSLDELPELLNVIRGEMSLVGPRPLRVEYLARYSAEQARRHEVKPGLTGWAQVNGRNALDWEERFALDVWYVDNQSLTLDVRILAQTFWKVLRRDGISPLNTEYVAEFRGNKNDSF